MAKRLITLMAALLMLGFLATGCGDDDSPGDSADTAAQTVTDTVTDEDVVTDDEVVTDTTETETVTDPDVTSNDNGGAAVPNNREQAEASCRRTVTSFPQVSEDTKSDLEDLCEKVASADPGEAGDGRRELCEKLVDDVYPSGVPGKETARSACEKSVK